MADNLIERPELVDLILEDFGQLRVTLFTTYQLARKDITSIRVDGDNVKIDVTARGRTYRFKAKGDMDVLAPSPADPAILQMKLDPALNQAVRLIVAEYAPS